MADLLKAYKSNFAKGGAFKMRFRSKKQPCQTISVLSKEWGTYKRGELANVFGATVLRAAEPLPETLAYDSRLQRTKAGRVLSLHCHAAGEPAREPSARQQQRQQVGRGDLA